MAATADYDKPRGVGSIPAGGWKRIERASPIHRGTSVIDIHFSAAVVEAFHPIRP